MNRCTASRRFLVALALQAAAVSTTSAAITCQTGWNNQIQEIPQDWINDGYCDCPFDAVDEPNTDACSGSTGWPGIPKATPTSASPATFACPQQPLAKLPLSRLHDGICDCCDGADEAPGSCIDNCEQILKAEREAKAKREQAFAIGQNKRKHELYAFKRLREEKLKEIQDLQQQLESIDPTVPLVQAQDLQLAYLSQRMAVGNGLMMASSSMTETAGMLAGLSVTELTTVLALLCQVAGEMDLKEDTDTCVALRLAALEVGMTWPEDNYQDPGEFKIQMWNSTSLELATRIFANAANDQRLWKVDGVSDQQKRRRLDEELMHEDEEDFHDYDGAFHDDDYLPGDNLDDEESSEEVQTEPVDDLTGLQKNLVEKVQALSFSVTRNALVNRAKEIMAQISSLLAAQASETPDEEDQPEEETPNEQETPPEITPSVDPVAYNMLRSSLQRKISTITKGYNWGASSFLFTLANPDLAEDQLRQLAMYTIYHGSISALQVWQVLQAALDELVVPPTTDMETCASPWASSCPPKTITRNGITLPNSVLVQVAQQFCSEQTEAAIASCASNSVDSNGIPITIPEGYYGYSTPVPRGQDDPIATIFAPLTALPADKEGLENLKKEQDRLEKEKKSVEKKIADIWKDIGGKNGDEMGPGGELHSLANKCFDVQAGKYTYEVCVFGQAKQKDDSGGSTGLGSFTRMDRNEETGQRILLWENGQKCWNGPSRSATVYLTCGPDNKVLSADEPDTCRYVLQMESYIACDDDYKKSMGL